MPSKGYTQIKTFPVPVGILDTMLFEIERGRSCDSLQKALNFEILALNAVSLSKDKAITLQKGQIQTYAVLEGNLRDQMQNQVDLFQIERSNLKQKIRKRNKILVGQGLVIAILVALIVGG